MSTEKEPTHYVVKNKILELETQFDVDKWIVNGIYVWPYIRIKLFFLLLTNSNSETQNTNASSESKDRIKKTDVLNKFRIIAGIAESFIKNELFFLQLKKKKIVFFGSHIHRVIHQGVHFSRFFDSMIASHNLENDVYMIEHQKVYHSNYNPKAIIRLERKLHYYNVVNKIKSKFIKFQIQKTLPGYEAFLQLLAKEVENAASLNISESDLIYWTKKIQNTTAFYNRFLKKVKPSKVIFPGYYAWDNLYAAVLAANNLKIKTIDFQHGPQTNVRMVFTGWNKIPLEGYGIMPIEYWTWDEKSKINIESWANIAKNITVKIVGQPYLEYWKKHNKGIDVDEKLILYSLQLMQLPQTFNEGIVDLIKKSATVWQIRLHPRNEFTKEDIQKYLDLAGVDNSAYLIHDSGTLPLPEILSKTFLHVTAFSGCLIEAKMMGVPTVIINNIGNEMFKDYIDNNLVYYLDPKNDNFQNEFFKLLYNLKNNELTYEVSPIVNPIFI